MNADGSQQTRITNNPAQDVYPGWGESSVVSSTFDVDASTQRLSVLMTATTNIEDDSLVLESLDSGDPVSTESIHGVFDQPSHIATFTFPGFTDGALPDGNYQATVEGKTSTFYTLAADGNRDRVVDIKDFNILAADFGKSGKEFTQGNYDYSPDGQVSIFDFNILAANFGKQVAPLPPPTGLQVQTQSLPNIERLGMSLGTNKTRWLTSDDDLLDLV